MSGALDLGNNRINDVLSASSAQDASTKIYIDNLGALQVSKAGDEIGSIIYMNLNKITDVADPLLSRQLILV